MPLSAGCIFVTGRDPDVHARCAAHNRGRAHFRPDGSDLPILLLESNTSNNLRSDHLDSEVGLDDRGYTASAASGGNHYVKVNAARFATINLSFYSALFVASDHGGSLTRNDLQALDARSADILTYLKAGGGLVALAEDGDHQPPTAGAAPALFGFLPFLVSSAASEQQENTDVLTAAGLSLGLTNSDINGNFSHNIFTATGGMNVVDTNAAGQILSLDFRGTLTTTGVTPEPSTMLLLGSALVGIALLARRRRA